MPHAGFRDRLVGHDAGTSKNTYFAFSFPRPAAMKQTEPDLRPETILKPQDTWWTVLVVDPICIPLLRLLVRIPGVTPLQLTLFAFAIGVVCIGMFAAGWVMTAGLLFELRYVFDCLDGKLARATKRTSDIGAFIDLAGDTAIVGGAYAALGYWAYQQGLSGAWSVLVLLPVFAASQWLHLYRRLALGQTERGGPASRAHPRSFFRRLRPYPTSTEVETVLLFLYPVAAPAAWFPFVTLGAGAFYALSALDSVRRVIAFHRQRPASLMNGGPQSTSVPQSGHSAE